jgi:hypothetical protein
MKRKTATKRKTAVLRKQVPRAGISLTSGETNSAPPYEQGFREVLALIEGARVRSYQAVNTELIDRYWAIGERISQRIASDGWGKSTIVSLAAYIPRRDPNARGFSAQNLWRIRQFYETWCGEKKLSALLRELSWTNNLLILGKCKRLANAFAPCPGGTLENSPTFQRWVWPGGGISPEGTAEIALPHPPVSRPFGTYPMGRLDPTLKRWAILRCPSGTGHAGVGSDLDGVPDLCRYQWQKHVDRDGPPALDCCIISPAASVAGRGAGLQRLAPAFYSRSWP